MISCSDNDSRSVDGEVQTNELWIYNFASAIPVENRIGISNPPRNAELSEITWDTINGGLSYLYRSIEGFTGVEFITIEFCSSSPDNNFLCTDINITLEVIE